MDELSWIWDDKTGEIRCGGELIATVAGATIYNTEPDREKAFENARLIASAPELKRRLAKLMTIASPPRLPYGIQDNRSMDMAKATVIDRIELTRRRMALREKLTAEPNDLSPTTELRGLISDLDKIRGFNEWQTRTISQ